MRSLGNARQVDEQAMTGLRARVAVGGQWGEWGPWQLGTNNLGHILAAILEQGSGGSSADLVKDDGTVVNGETIRSTTDDTATLWTDTAGQPTRLAYGTGAATPARGDYAVSGEVAQIAPSSSNHDEAAGVMTVTGSRIHTEANATITRAGLYVRGRSGTFLWDHATVPDDPVVTDENVAVQYQLTL